MVRLIGLFLLFALVTSNAFAGWYGPRHVTIPVVNPFIVSDEGPPGIELTSVLYYTYWAEPESDISSPFLPYHVNSSDSKFNGDDINLISLSGVKYSWDGDYNVILDVTAMKEVKYSDDYVNVLVVRSERVVYTFRP